jgi:eukaryotic-like serine/threonine-protein kinase
VAHGDPQELLGVGEGDVLAGKYRVERILGVGGMGAVVAARHLQLDSKVALKFLLPAMLGDREAVERFAREARAAVQITNEHVARVTDVGTLDNGAPYIVMEYLEGGDLAAWVQERGALPIEQAIDFVLQSCIAVADAHALGIIHRDLKPANLFCVRRSDGQLCIKVLDFGISKVTRRSGSVSAQGFAFTKTSAVMGSPLYMSPEQMRSSREVDSRTDIWALGVILFELLAGRTPFLAETLTELAIKIATNPIPSIRGFRPEVPVALEAVIGKCLGKEPPQRYRNVAELALALLPFAPRRANAWVERVAGILQTAGLSTGTMAVPPSPQSPPRQAFAGTLPPLGRTIDGERRARRMAVRAGVVGLASLATVATLVLHRRAPGGAGPPTAPSGSTILAPAVSGQDRPLDAPPASETMPAGPVPSPSTTQASAPVRPVPNPAGSAKEPRAPMSTSAPVRTAVAAAAAIPAQPPTPLTNCKPPYYFDARGNRVFKPECL